MQRLRHQCRQCGASCQGTHAQLIGDEPERMVEYAAALGIDDPIDGSHLRLKNGHCVFLDPQNQCRVHTHHGFLAKPRICQQYPIIRLSTESGDRYGIDPGCLQSIQSWRTGPTCDHSDLVARRVTLGEEWTRSEQRLMHACEQPGMTAHQLVAMVCGAHKLPADFFVRLKHTLGQPRLRQLLETPDTGNGTREALSGVLDNLDDHEDQWPELPDDSATFALDVIARVVKLRLVHRLPPVASVVLMGGGIVAAGWANPHPAVFGPAVSAWTRVLRARPFLLSLTPGPEHLRWLMTGVKAD